MIKKPYTASNIKMNLYILIKLSVNIIWKDYYFFLPYIVSIMFTTLLIFKKKLKTMQIIVFKYHKREKNT